MKNGVILMWKKNEIWKVLKMNKIILVNKMAWNVALRKWQ
jgi:hypothetical protein